MGIHALVLGSLKPIPAQVLDSPLLDEVSILTEPGCAGYYGPEANVSLVSSVEDFTAVRDAALSLFASGRVDAVLTPTEFGIATGGLLRTCYGFDGMGFETAHAFANKYVMKQRLAAAGVPVTPFRPVYRIDGIAGVADELGWPVVVKPVFGSGTVGVTVVGSPAEFARCDGSPAATGLAAAGLPLIAERHVDIEVEYHCDGVVVDGETVFAAVSRYLSPVLRGLGGLQGSYHLPAEHPDAVAVRDLHAAAVASLGMRSGVTHLEAFKTADGFLVGEVACRPGGGGIVRGVELQYGVDLWRAFMETSLGMRPELDPVRRERTVVTLMLPARPGRITRLSTAEELSAVPGVAEVSMLHTVGDVISDVMYSTNITGLVFLEAPAPDDVDTLIRGVAEAYACTVSPDASIPA